MLRGHLLLPSSSHVSSTRPEKVRSRSERRWNCPPKHQASLPFLGGNKSGKTFEKGPRMALQPNDLSKKHERPRCAFGAQYLITPFKAPPGLSVEFSPFVPRNLPRGHHTYIAMEPGKRVLPLAALFAAVFVYSAAGMGSGLQCFVEGECRDSQMLDFSKVNNSQECLKRCQVRSRKRNLSRGIKQEPFFNFISERDWMRVVHVLRGDKDVHLPHRLPQSERRKMLRLHFR